MYNYKSSQSEGGKSSSGVLAWCLVILLHNPSSFINQNSFQIIQIVTEYEKSYSQAIF